jgi:hypothetical protein
MDVMVRHVMVRHVDPQQMLLDEHPERVWMRASTWGRLPLAWVPALERALERALVLVLGLGSARVLFRVLGL